MSSFTPGTLPFPPSSSPSLQLSNDPSFALSSHCYLIHQLSLLLLNASLHSTVSTSLASSHNVANLSAALVNVVCTAYQALPPFLLSPPTSSFPCPPPSDAPLPEHTPPPSSTPSPSPSPLLSPSHSPSPASHLTIREITSIESLPPPPRTATAPRRPVTVRPRSAPTHSPSLSPSSSPRPVANSSPRLPSDPLLSSAVPSSFAALSNDEDTDGDDADNTPALATFKPATPPSPRPRRQSLPSSLPPSTSTPSTTLRTAPSSIPPASPPCPQLHPPSCPIPVPTSITTAAICDEDSESVRRCRQPFLSSAHPSALLASCNSSDEEIVPCPATPSPSVDTALPSHGLTAVLPSPIACPTPPPNTFPIPTASTPAVCDEKNASPRHCWQPSLPLCPPSDLAPSNNSDPPTLPTLPVTPSLITPTPPIIIHPAPLPNASPPPPATCQRTTTRSSCSATHPFFKTLSSRPRFLTKHFTTHFLSSSPVCSCQRFPVHTSKLSTTSDSSSSILHPALSHLCLVCARFFTGKEFARGKLDRLWNRTFENEWAAYYKRFYTPDEEDDFRSEEQPQDWHHRMNFTMTRLWPLLGKKLPSEEELNEMKKDAVESTQEEEGKNEEEDKTGEDKEGENEDIGDTFEDLWWYVDPYGNPFGSHFDDPYANPFSADGGLEDEEEEEVEEEWE